MGAGFGVAGQLLIAGGLAASAGWTGPVVTLLAPAAVAMLAALVIRAGWGATGFAIGQVVAAQVGPLLMPSIVMPQTIDLVLSLAAGLVGYAVGAGILLAPSMPDFQPPSPVDLSRFEADARGQLRGIDPEAPGAFERATVLLRRVNEQVGMASTWMYGGGKPPADPGPSPGLLEVQAELVETARIAAIKAGARRVTITSSGMGGGIDVQAVFGDPIAADEDLPSTSIDVD